MDNKMNVQDLAAAFAASSGCDIKTATSFVKVVFEIVEEYVTRDKLVKIKGLGTFKLISVSDRESVNVNTGERIVIAGHSKLTFTPDTALRDAVNRPFGDFETVVLNESTSLEDMERFPSSDSVLMEEDLADVVVDATDAPVDEGQPEPDEGLDFDQPETAECLDQPETTEDLDQPEPDDAALEGETAGDVPEDEVQVALEEGVAAVPDNRDVGDDAQPSGADVVEEVAEAAASVAESQPNAEVDASAVNVGQSDAGSQEPEPVAEPAVQVKSVEQAEVHFVQHRASSAENPVYPMSAEPLDETDVMSSGGGYKWWHLLLVLLLMAGSYALGHYRVLGMLDIDFHSEDAGPETAAVQPEPEVKVVVPVDTVAEVDSLQVTDTLEVAPAEPEEDPAEIAKFYPQVRGGEYWIVGDAGRVHYMEVGETLYRIARKELGDQNLVRYLIVFNKFEDPNIIHTGDVIRIPKLVKKVQAQE